MQANFHWRQHTPRVPASQRAIGLSGTLQAAEQFSGVQSGATPRRAGSIVKWSQHQTKIPPRAPVHIMGAEWTQNRLGMKSRLPIYDPGVWPDSGVGWTYRSKSGLTCGLGC